MKQSRLFWAVLCVCLGFVIWNGYLLNQLTEQAEARYLLNASIQELQKQVEEMAEGQIQAEADQEKLRNELVEAQKLMAIAPMLNEVMIKELKSRGVEEPQEVLKDLLEQSQLIPYEGVLGGTMFMAEGWLLTDRFALAVFEDGHVMGHMVLEYDIDGGSIHWKVLSAYLD